MAKRLLDIVFSLTGVLIFLPFGIVICLILRLTGEGEVFYRQRRVGKDGVVFDLLKFATMLKNSPNLGAGLLTLKNDPRVLPFGGFLRKTKLNEVPQLLNILKGDMSVVGPRPQAKAHFEVFPDHVKKAIVACKPGLTGIGSIEFRDEESLLDLCTSSKDEFYKDVIAPYKGELEIWYLKNSSLYVDLLLILLTGWVVIFPKSRMYERLFKDLPARPAELVQIQTAQSQLDLG